MPIEKAVIPAEPASDDVADVIEIRDSEVDVDALMAQVRANVAKRKAEGAYQEDLDAIAQQVFTEVISADPLTLQPTGSGLAQTIQELHQRWPIQEPPFVSHAPVVGQAIVAVRNFWNWMSTKWYVRAILQQLVGFNGLVIRGFQDVRAEQQQLDSRIQALEAVCQQQRQELDLLRQEVGRLQASAAPAPSSKNGRGR
jgi:hypothetical protein